MCSAKRSAAALLTAALVLFAAAGCGGVSDENGREQTGSGAPATVSGLTHTTLERGYSSGIDEQMSALVQNDGDWNELWNRHAAPYSPSPQAPAVDFDRESVLAVYMGEQRSGGYSVEILTVEVSGSGIAATVRQTRPGPDALVTGAITQPYHLVRLPRLPDDTKVTVRWQ